MAVNQYVISEKDRTILRELAKKQYEYSQADKNKKRIQEWYAHNSLKGERPMIHLEMWTFAQEILPQRLRCEGEFARSVETSLYCNFLNQELFDDDRVTPDYFQLDMIPILHCLILRLREKWQKAVILVISLYL